MELLEIIKLFAHTNVFDRLTGYGKNGQCRTASCIRIKLRHKNAGDSHSFIKGFGNVYSVLTGHSVNDQHNFVRLGDFLNIFKLLHELSIYVKTSGSIDNKYIVTVVLCMAESLLCNDNRTYLSHFKYLYPGFLAYDLKLIYSGRTVNITGGKKGTMSLFFQELGKLSRMSSLT